MNHYEHELKIFLKYGQNAHLPANVHNTGAYDAQYYVEIHVIAASLFNVV